MPIKERKNNHCAGNTAAHTGAGQRAKKEQKILFRHIISRYQRILCREKDLEEVTLQKIVLQVGCLSWLRRNDLIQKEASVPELIQQVISLYSGSRTCDGPGFLPAAAAQLTLFFPEQKCRISPAMEQDLYSLLSLFDTGAVFPDDPCMCGRYFGRLLEELLCAGKQPLSGRKKTGSFYTPESVVSRMVRDALTLYLSDCLRKDHISFDERSMRILTGEKHSTLPRDLIRYRAFLVDHLKQCRILDPACGSGAFLLGAHSVLDEVWSRLETGIRKERKHPSFRRKYFLMEHCLYGVDIQSLPLKILEFTFLMILTQENGGKLPEKLPMLHVREGNALLDRSADLQEHFDLVLGNPPYVPVTMIDVSRRQEYKKYFAFAGGRFNLFTLFLEKSRFWMKQNGICFFLVPDRLLLNTQYTALCRKFFTDMELCEYLSFKTPVFPDAAVDAVVLGYRKSEYLPVPLEKRLIPCRKEADPANLVIRDFDLLTFEQICQYPRFETETKTISDKIKAVSVPLGTIARTKDGIIQGAVGEVLFCKGSSSLPPHAEKLLYGRNITAYRISYDDDYVNYDEEGMKILELQRVGTRPTGLRLRKREIFTCPKILTRQTADRIIAALDEKGEYFYANTLHGTTVTDTKYDLYFLLGILNSSLATFLYRSQSMEQGKTFAQIKIALLSHLPVPVMDKLRQEKIISLVKKLLVLKGKQGRSSGKTLRRRIDLILYEFYGLSASEQLLVEKRSS